MDALRRTVRRRPILALVLAGIAGGALTKLYESLSSSSSSSSSDARSQSSNNKGGNRASSSSTGQSSSSSNASTAQSSTSPKSSSASSSSSSSSKPASSSSAAASSSAAPAVAANATTDKDNSSFRLDFSRDWVADYVVDDVMGVKRIGELLGLGTRHRVFYIGCSVHAPEFEALYEATNPRDNPDAIIVVPDSAYAILAATRKRLYRGAKFISDVSGEMRNKMRVPQKARLVSMHVHASHITDVSVHF